MDLDLEIISEESDCPDLLFDSIMNAMNSMKEATADKIYQRIQKEGETNYSKPQVGRALASALKYGIFEIRNNRYRVRDDILDDEDTVYWKLQKKRKQTPFRIQDDINERQFGPKLDPERDNQRFKKVANKEGQSQECPHCGRIKRPGVENKKFKKSGNVKTPKKRRKPSKKERAKTHNAHNSNNEEHILKKKTYTQRNKRKINEERCAKKRKICGKKFNEPTEKDDPRDAENRPQEEAYDSSDSEINFLSPTSNEQSFKSCSEESKKKFRNRDKQSRSPFSLECIDADDIKAKLSSTSLKLDSESDQMDVSSFSFDHGRNEDSFFESLPCTSRNSSSKTRNQYLSSTEMFRNQYEGDQTSQHEEKSDWLGCSDEPQGTIILSNNVLTIEPMDSLTFKSPEQASYIS